MTINELFHAACDAEEQAYQARALEASGVSPIPPCPKCESRGHVYEDGYFLSGDWWCSRCNVSFKTES